MNLFLKGMPISETISVPEEILISEISDAGFKNLKVLFTVNVYGNGSISSFAVRHLTKATTVR